MHGRRRKACSVLTGKPEGKGRHRMLSDRGIILKWHLRETGRERFDWNRVAQYVEFLD
jgi:hypothetical protein